MITLDTICNIWIIVCEIIGFFNFSRLINDNLKKLG